MGLVVALAFFTILLRIQPYVKADDDLIQSIATGSTVMTLLIGFTLKINGQHHTNTDTTGDYDIALLDSILVGLFCLVAISGGFILVKTLPCCAGCVGKQNQNQIKKVRSSVKRENHRVGNRLKSKKTLSVRQIREAVVHDKVVKIQAGYDDERVHYKDIIRARGEKANARVRQRLVERANDRAKRTKQESQVGGK